MSEFSLADIPSIWRDFLIDLTFAKNYTTAYSISTGLSPKNPVIEKLMPSLLLVKVVSILDHSLRAWISENHVKIPKNPYGTDLKGRINYLADHHHITERKSLHEIRELRNVLAHESAGTATWKELDKKIETVWHALSELNLVGEFPKLDTFSESSGALPGEIPNALCTIHYRVGIKQDDKMIAEIRWSEHMMADGA